jgi:RNA polymerase sigma-70 factor (ECF subfamily)
VDSDGATVLLGDQDRTRWDAARIEEGVTLVGAGLRRSPDRPDRYVVQAAIAACHATATGPADTDWAQIALLYAAMSRLTASPVVELNRAVAVAMADGPEAGLLLVEALVSEGALTGYYLLSATRADLLRRLGRTAEAALAYREARGLAPTEVERRYFDRRLTEIGAAQ